MPKLVKESTGIRRYKDFEIYNAEERKTIGLHNQILEKIDQGKRIGERRIVPLSELIGIYHIGNESVYVDRDYLKNNLKNVDSNNFATLDSKLKEEIKGYILHSAQQRKGISNSNLTRVSDEMASSLIYHDLNGIYSLSSELVSDILTESETVKTQSRRTEYLARPRSNKRVSIFSKMYGAIKSIF